MSENREEQIIVWIDTETTGIDPKEHYLLEIAAIATDLQGNEISRYKGASKVRYACAELVKAFASMDDYVISMHEKSGLAQELMLSIESTPPEGFAPMGAIELSMLEWLAGLGITRAPLLGGNSVAFDRAFLEENMPALAGVLHYRNIDATCIETFATQAGLDVRRRGGNYTHRAADDIAESVETYRRCLAAVRTNNLEVQPA